MEQNSYAEIIRGYDKFSDDKVIIYDLMGITYLVKIKIICEEKFYGMADTYSSRSRLCF
jgi:hypothetical protein